jgi:2-phospho-L-lactate transferase/gluconeogenesis factor (CofD/UPF0052 family)
MVKMLWLVTSPFFMSNQNNHFNHDVSHPHAAALREENVVLIGGGSGMSRAAYALAGTVNQLTAVATVTDSGGDSGRQAVQFDTLPVGDIRRNTAALSPYAYAMRYFDGKTSRLGPNATPYTVAFMGRRMIASLIDAGHDFDVERAVQIANAATDVADALNGGLAGSSYGNLFYTAQIAKNFMGTDINEATRVTGEIVGARGRVLAVSEAQHHINLHEVSGLVTPTQDAINNHDIADPLRAMLRLDRQVTPNRLAVAALAEADKAIFTQGSLWTSELPPALVLGDALRLPRALGAVINLIEDNGTAGLAAADHIAILERHAGVPLDFAIHNTDYGAIPGEYTPVYGTPETPIVIGTPLVGEDARGMYGAHDIVAAVGHRTPLLTNAYALAQAVMSVNAQLETVTV